MLGVIFGNENAERVLQYLLAKENGYLSEISEYYGIAPSILKKQLDKFESGNVIVGKSVGRTRVFELNPRYPFIKELIALLKRARMAYPEEEREDLINPKRVRFRKKDKPLEYKAENK
jgi:hypothetical protein